MRRLSVSVLLSVLLLALPGQALAQPAEPQFGLVAASNSSVGLLWQVTDRVAMRPSFVVSRYSTNFDYGSLAAYDTFGGVSASLLGSDFGESSTAFAFEIDALLTLARRDALRLYVTPGFGTEMISGSLYDDAATEYSISGAFGVQYSLSDRFSLFGESGVRYSHSSNGLPDYASLLLPGSAMSASTFGTRSKVGVVFHF